MQLLFVFFMLRAFTLTSAIITYNDFLNVLLLLLKTTKISWEIFDELHDDQLVTGKHNILKEVKKISDIQFAVDKLDAYDENVFSELKNFESEIKYDINIQSLLNCIADLEVSYELFKTYSDNRQQSYVNIINTRRDLGNVSSQAFEKYTLLNFAKDTVSHQANSVYSNFLKINLLILGSVSNPYLTGNGKGLLNIIMDYINSDLFKCGAKQSPCQWLIHFFSVLQKSQLKAYLMIEYSWVILRINGQGNFTEERLLLKHSLFKHTTDQIKALLKSLEDTSNTFWKCDSPVHVEGQTYTQVTHFLQGYIVNEVDINDGGTCWQNCAYYSQSTKQFDCYLNLFCASQPRCNGTLVGCRYHDSDMWVCHSSSNTHRLYDYVSFDNGDVYGEEKTCDSVSKASSWYRWLFWHCSYCFCYCDDPTNSDRYFNLRPVVSDIAKNKIVTGIRFVKVNNVIHLQIQEGQVIEEASLNSSSISWRDVDGYRTSDSNVKEFYDYYSLTWEMRSIDLDDIVVPENHLVTGVKFKLSKGSLKLEVQATLFDYKTGYLINPLTKSFWMDNTAGSAYLLPLREEVKLERPDIPVRLLLKSKVLSKTNQFVQFQSSDDKFDAGQSTVPFIDTQEVAPYPSTPLVGIGLHHKGRKYSGGFIAPKVFTYKNKKSLISFSKNLKERVYDGYY